MNYPGSLHNHTDASNLRLRDSINTIKGLIDTSISLGHEVCAITEHDTVSSAIKAEKYYKKIKEKNPNFKLILGNEIYLCRNGLNKQNFDSKLDKYFHFILLAKDLEGHRQIREISTRAWNRSYMSRGLRRVPTYYQDLYDIIGKNPGHVIGSTACLGGALGVQLLRYKESKDELLLNKIKEWIVNMKNLFLKDNFFLEMQPSFNKDQIYVNNKILELSKELEVDFIITNDAHYALKEDRPIHKAFLNSQDGDREVDEFYATTYLMTDSEIKDYMEKFIGIKNIEKAYSNINKIKSMCEDYSLLKSLKIPNLKWKKPNISTISNFYLQKIPYLTNFINSTYEGDRILALEIVEKIEKDKTLQNDLTYNEINDNLRMVLLSSEKNNTHWSAYLLNLQRIIDVCWEAGTIVGPGRGSGVGFLLLYILGITQINPLREKTKTYSWRFLNPDRVSVLDIDIDIEGSRREQVLEAFRKVYGEDRVANVVTFGTEKSKSAILTAARGLGIDVDIAQYLSSLVPAERGITYTLSQCFYGDEENGIKPIPQFVNEMTNNYPELWKVAQKIEGLINRTGVHAGGVIFVDEPFTNSTAIMRAPDGTTITQFDLHDAEDVGLIKYDLLSVEAMDKIHICLDLLCDYDYVKRENSLKETYEKVIGIYNLERENKEMWKMIWEHKIQSLFQMEQQSGIQGIALTRPESVDDLATLNSVIRLMAQEKGAEQPLSKYARFKKDINNWYNEMDKYGLTKEEQELLKPVLSTSYGICESQERFMTLVQMPECGGFNLTWADSLRKAIAKKNPEQYMLLEKEYFKVIKEKGLSKNLCNYVWRVLVAQSRGYGFNLSHTLAYSLIALQEMNLAFNFPIEFWNCANLITDCGGIDLEDNEDIEEDEDNEEEDCEELEEEEKKKKKTKTTDYGKIASSIGKMKNMNINVSLPDINLSKLIFTPDIKNHTILFGIKGISRINLDLAKTIINNRPYTSMQDFINKVKISKPPMVNLIKAGCFDKIENKSREDIMKDYIDSISEKKNKLTLQNMAMLIREDCLPKEFEREIHIYNFNKYLKNFKSDIYYLLDERAFNFYEKLFDMDLIEQDENKNFKIKQSYWDKIYKKQMENVKQELKTNASILENLNNKLFNNMWEKYASGNRSKWEMDSVSFYYDSHELKNIDKKKYYIDNFFDLPEEPEVDTIWQKDGKDIPIFKLHRICGTVIDKNKIKNSVTLLTEEGVVTVKIYRAQFSKYDRQISVKDPVTGKKTIIEKSWFKRGNKVMIAGIRRGNEFIPKIYKRNNKFDFPIELILSLDEKTGEVVLAGERAE